MDEENNEGGNITISKESLWKYSTFILAAIVIVGLFIFVGDDSPTPSGNVIDNGKPVNVEIGDSPVKGDKDAKVTIVEFSDYQCPFCGRHFLQTYGQIEKEYVDTGKVKIVFKDYPLAFHAEAQKSAEAARCFREQKGDEGYYQMHDKLFSNQATLSLENYKKWARELGADGNKFDACLDSGKYAKDIQSDLEYGQKLGVQGTPAFFINGKLVSGAQPYSVFKQAIEAEL